MLTAKVQKTRRKNSHRKKRTVLENRMSNRSFPTKEKSTFWAIEPKQKKEKRSLITLEELRMNM